MHFLGRFKLKPIVINQKKDDYDVKDKITLQSFAITALPSIGGEPDVIRTLQLMPGIKSGTETASGLFVRAARQKKI